MGAEHADVLRERVAMEVREVMEAEVGARRGAGRYERTAERAGGTYSPAVCQRQGARTTNGNDSDPSDDGNPSLFSSTRWYGVRLPAGNVGFISEVWIDPSQRGGLGLAGC